MCRTNGPVREAPVPVAPDGHLTYAELDRAANRIAHALWAAEAVPDQPVGVLLEPSTWLAAALLGVLKAGAGYLPLDPGCPPNRIRTTLTAAGARLVVTTGEFAEPARAAGCTVLAVEDLTGHRRPDRTCRCGRSTCCT